jgi:hypothetical protein
MTTAPIRKSWQPTPPIGKPRIVMNGGHLDIQASVDLVGLKQLQTMLQKYAEILEMMTPRKDAGRQLRRPSDGALLIRDLAALGLQTSVIIVGFASRTMTRARPDWRGTPENFGGALQLAALERCLLCLGYTIKSQDNGNYYQQLHSSLLAIRKDTKSC